MRGSAHRDGTPSQPVGRSSAGAAVGAALVAALLAWSSPASGQASALLEVPLTQGLSAAEAFVAGLGGSVQGGSFDGAGWTTTSRDDLLWVALPAGVDWRDARLSVSFRHPELGGQTTTFESYILVSLREAPPPYQATPTGHAGVQSLYVAFAPDNPSAAPKPKAYFNLFDAGCTDWHLCTGEAGAPGGFLSTGDTLYTIEQRWQHSVDQVVFTGDTVVNRTIDLAATSPDGVIQAPQMYLLVNACGGSTANSCGLWGGPVHGGPIGVTYTAVELEVFASCGDGTCGSYVESCEDCPADCGPCGQGGSAAGGGGAGGAAAQGGRGPGGSLPGAGGGPAGGAAAPALSSPPGEDASCGCLLAGGSPRRRAAFPWLLGMLALPVVARRLRTHRGDRDRAPLSLRIRRNAVDP